MDFEAVAAGLTDAIPFNRHLGLVVEEVAPGRGVVTLPEGEQLHNHDRKIARGPITAVGTLEGDVSELMSSIDADGRVEFPIDVELTDGDGNVVATMTVQWHVRRNNA